MTFNNQPAPLTLRANRLRTSPRRPARNASRSRDVEAHAGRFAPDAPRHRRAATCGDELGARRVRRAGRGVAAGRAAGRAGAGTAACSIPARRPAARPPPSPTTLGVGERLIACDVRDRRMALLQRTVAATGATERPSGPGRRAAPLPFGTRVLHRHRRRALLGSGHPSTRSRYQVAARRRSDLAGASQPRSARCSTTPPRSCAGGGRLVYATCSSEPEENEEVVAAFLGARIPNSRRVAARTRPIRAVRRPIWSTTRRAPANRARSARPGAVLRRRVRARSASCRYASRVHGLSNPRLERGQAAGARRRARRDLRPVCGRVHAGRAPGARSPGSRSHQSHRERGDVHRRPTRPRRSASTTHAGRIRRFPPGASSRRIRRRARSPRQQRSVRVWLSAGPRAPPCRR